MKNVIENIELIVPSEKQLRRNIRQKIDRYFSENEIIPPVSYQQISSFAAKLIKINSWPTELHAFVMVCCGNAIWRRIVSTIPFNRRILLLPQCLRNSKLCKAKSDQFGLLCEGCNQCSINDYIDEAEKLGYVVLVTEGTTATARLIESGKIDAVIGVGCMEVLQKIFSSIEKYAVPGIGIPLLGNGCKDTVADQEWIREELHFIDQKNSINLLNISQIHDKIRDLFNTERLKELLSASNNETIEIAIKSMLMGGNRYRAFLSALTYEAFSDNPQIEVIEHIALSVECFHKASLIHDDIEDNDFTRYGKDTIHKEYGVPVAINVGDLLIGEGYRLITEIGFSPEIAAQCFQLLSNSHRSMTLGQGTELISTSKGKILSIEELLKVFEQKTSTAFKVSLLLGAIAAGADNKSIEILDNFSRNTGTAYQIMDDISDFNSHVGDIEKRKISVLISLLFSSLSDAKKERLQISLRISDFDDIYKQIDQNRIKEKAIQLLKLYIQNAKSSIDDLKNPGLKIALHAILGKMFTEYL